MRGGSVYVGNIDKDIITITKIVQNENEIMQNQVFVEFQISVNPERVHIMLMKVSKLKFKKSVIESINKSYNENVTRGKMMRFDKEKCIWTLVKK